MVTDDAFAGRLLNGERIVWSGRPAQGIILTGRDALMIPFSLVWCGFAVFWTRTAAMSGAPGFFKLWGLMFVAIGLFFVAGRFLFDAWIRRRVYYAVTNRRILISRQGPFRSFTALSLDQMPEAQLSERQGGRGTIRFGRTTGPWGNRGSASWTPSLDPTPQFIVIDDARQVFDLVQRPT